MSEEHRVEITAWGVAWRVTVTMESPLGWQWWRWSGGTRYKDERFVPLGHFADDDVQGTWLICAMEQGDIQLMLPMHTFPIMEACARVLGAEEHARQVVRAHALQGDLFE